MPDAATPLSSPFSEAAYLAAYPDIAEAVRNGVHFSGKHHYLLHGYREGRTEIGAAEITRAAPPVGGSAAELRDFGFYHRNGFLVFDSGLSDEVLDGAVAGLAPMYRDDPKQVSTNSYDVAYADHIRVQDAWRASPQVRAVATAPAILAKLRMLYDRQAFAFQTLNFRRGSEQKIHSDTVHFNSRPSGYMVGVWVALEDIDHTRGPLMFYPGTHRLPEVLIPDMQAADADMDYAAYEDFLSLVFGPGCGWTANYALLRRGQALVWAANLHHGGSPQKDRSLSRHSQVTHYFFEGSEYWTPRMSHHGKVFSRKPAIITAR